MSRISFVASLAICVLVLGATSSARAITLSDDFNEPNGTLLDGKLPDVGQAWDQTSGGALTIQNGTVDTTGGARVVFGQFNEALSQGKRLVFDFDTNAKANFHSGGFAGMSLFQGNTERVFIGDLSGATSTWGLAQSGLNFSSSVSGGDQVGRFTYDHRTGAFNFALGGNVLTAGTIGSGFAIDRVRFINDAGGDIIVDSLSVDLAANNPVALGGAAFVDDLSTTNGTPINGRIPTAGTMWLQTSGNAVSIQNGAIDTSGGARTIFGLFNDSLSANEHLIFDFETLAAPGDNFFSSGFAGISLFEGGTERVYIGDPSDTTSGWGLRQSGLNVNTLVSDDSILGSFFYDFNSGAYRFFINGQLESQGTITAGLAIDRFRIINNNGGDIVLSSVNARIQQIPEPATAALGLMGLAGLMMRRRRLA